MNRLLREGQTLDAASVLRPCLVEKFLGGGSQGEVYRVSTDGQAFALKWYFPHVATPEQKGALQKLVAAGPPDARFLWPCALIERADPAGFGYLMPLREPSYKSLFDLMKRRVEPSFRALATAGFQLADSFLRLHAKGLCYRDISFGNVFFDPDAGDARICDNDNVAVDGDSACVVGGTPRFMAPEIVRGEALPSVRTDLFSLATLLFYMLTIHHPLEGAREAAIRCFDLPAMKRLYGEEPLFVFDPDDESNRPVPGLHDNALEFWPLYPRFLQELFVRAFGVGLRDPDGRVRESEWRSALARLRDSIFYCGRCGNENFYDAERLQANGGDPGACWSCRDALRLPPRLRIDNRTIVLNHDTRLYPHHLDPQRLYDFGAPWAEVARHPTRADLWGLKNLSDGKWVMTDADGEAKDVEPGRSVGLASGAKIRFGAATGEIRA